MCFKNQYKKNCFLKYQQGNLHVTRKGVSPFKDQLVTMTQCNDEWRHSFRRSHATPAALEHFPFTQTLRTTLHLKTLQQVFLFFFVF